MILIKVEKKVISDLSMKLAFHFVTFVGSVTPKNLGNFSIVCTM